jgi:sortase A
MLGTTAFASVIVLALGGLALVGLDTVGENGVQPSRAAQPQVAQTPEGAKEKTASGESGSEKKPSGEERAAASEKSEEESADEKSSGDSEGSASKEDSSDKEDAKNESSNVKATKRTAETEEQKAASKEEEAAEKQAKKEKQEPEPPPDPKIKTMWMSIPKLGMYSDTVFNSSSHEQMGVGAIKLPPTGFPWQGGANTYVSAHRIGYPGTQSYNQFYALPAMQQGDMIYVGDANGTQYKYRVTKKFAVKPWENWVTEPKAGDDLLTLQTCIDSLDPNTWWDISPKLMRSGPDSARMIVRAEKVDTTYPQQAY